jgi:hypothetical protein
MRAVVNAAISPLRYASVEMTKLVEGLREAFALRIPMFENPGSSGGSGQAAGSWIWGVVERIRGSFAALEDDNEERATARTEATEDADSLRE